MNTEFEYMNEISKILEQVYEVNKDNIKIVAEKMAETIVCCLQAFRLRSQ